MKIIKANKKHCNEISKLIKGTFKNVNKKDRKDVIDWLIKKNNNDYIIKKLKDRELFLMVEKNKILATIDLEKDKIGGLYVKHDRIGEGIGRKMMEFIEDYARKKKIKKTRLFPTKTAFNFYKKLGYKTIAKHRWKTESFDTYIYEMEKKLK